MCSFARKTLGLVKICVPLAYHSAEHIDVRIVFVVKELMVQVVEKKLTLTDYFLSVEIISHTAENNNHIWKRKQCSIF